MTSTSLLSSEQCQQVIEIAKLREPVSVDQLISWCRLDAGRAMQMNVAALLKGAGFNRHRRRMPSGQREYLWSRKFTSGASDWIPSSGTRK